MQMVKLQILPEETPSLQVLEPIVMPAIKPRRITENGIYSAKKEGVDGFHPVEVAVDLTPAFEAGRQNAYDRFWDAFQQNGERTDYDYAFYGTAWKGIFEPKYDLKPTSAYGMFLRSNIRDLETALKNIGVVLDTSNCTDAFRMFSNMGFSDDCFEAVPELDLRKATKIGELFGYANIKIVRKIILNEQGTQDTSTLFHGGMQGLEEIRFEGVIGKNLRLQWSGKLSNESVQSIIDHLKDLTGATTQTLTFHKDVGARLTEAQKAVITAKNWTLVY